LFRDDVVSDDADSLDFDFHDVAGLNRTDAAGRAGVDDVAGLERREAGDVFDQLLDAKDELRCARLLLRLAVDPERDCQVAAVDLGVDNWPQRREGVETLPVEDEALGHLAALEVARADVVAHGVAENVLESLLCRDTAALPPDDD